MINVSSLPLSIILLILSNIPLCAPCVSACRTSFVGSRLARDLPILLILLTSSNIPFRYHRKENKRKNNIYNPLNTN